MSKNDDRIIELKKQIESKKKELSEKKVRFVPETNCVLDLDGVKYNLNVVSHDVLIMLLVKLNMYYMSAKELGIVLPLFSGYSIGQWISDIKGKMDALHIKREESDLKAKEAKLDKLLSDDKKTELEIDEIANYLKFSL